MDPFGLLDINLHKRGTPDWHFAEKIPSTPGTISIAGHGNLWWPVDANGEGITEGAMIEMINEFKKKKKPNAKSVKFYVCDLAAGTYAGTVAQETGMANEAPDTHVWTYSDGATPKVYYPRVDNEKLPDLKRPGTWVTSRPSVGK